MDAWKSMGGMLDVELTSAEPEEAIRSINTGGIEIFRIQRCGDLTRSFSIRRSSYKKVAVIVKKRGDTLRIVRKTGIYWAVKGLLNRPLLLAGILFLLVMALYLPSRVFFVRVEGNASVPARRILAAAEECGICFGASRREVRSEKVKNALLSAVPELQWAGVNTSGCVAIVSVRERTEVQTPQESNAVTSIVADRDGYILSATVTSGNALVQVGQTVKEGQMLVSGYTDCGICIRATRSEGEILAQTNRTFTAVTPSQCLQRTSVQDIRRSYSLLLRKKRINLWKDSGIWDSSCGRMYKEYYVTLPGGFQLPIALCVEEYVFSETQSIELPQPHAEEALSSFCDSYLTGHMVAGEIKRKERIVSLVNGCYQLDGQYVCVEVIGRVQREQIGDTNGKSG